jgi:Uncharacterised protein family (UPF0158)
MRNKSIKEAQNPLVLRCHRLIEAFTKSDDERDFYLDRQEGFIVYVDLDKPIEEIESLENELRKHSDRYFLIPKLTFYETKKIMEGFVNEKVYDIDTKEKLLEIIQSKEARGNFLEFIYDHHAEMEKWQLFYQERSRIRIIEWLRNNQFHFVFEEDLDLPRGVLEKVKRHLFETKVGKDIAQARKTLQLKAKTYYSNEALNPRPKRGRPPKQAVKLEIEPQVTVDVYTTVPTAVRSFLFTPDMSASGVTFSSKFESEEQLLAHRRPTHEDAERDLNLLSINEKLVALRNLSNKWLDTGEKETSPYAKKAVPAFNGDDDSFDDEDEDEDFEYSGVKSKAKPKAVKSAAKKLPKVKATLSSLKAAKPIKAAKPVKKVVPPKKGKIKLIDNKTAKGKPKQQIKAKKPVKLAIKKKRG